MASKVSLTFENVALSSRLLRSAIEGGIGFRVTEQDVKRKYIDLLQEYTSSDKLTAIEHLFTILQVASLGPTHQFAFGFIIWAPKTMQPPLSMLCRRNRVFSFCLWHMKLISLFNLALPRMIILKTVTSYLIAPFLDFLLMWCSSRTMS